MEPLFFGPGNALYGGYHPPAFTRSDPETAIVLCQSFGHEYMRAQRACWQVAEAAAARNAHVLRFDYPATGDSRGEPHKLCARDWLEAIGQAVVWLSERSGLNEVRLMGLRLGALLAAQYAAIHGSIRLVLWDPVVDGADFVAGLRSEHRTYTREQNRYRRWRDRHPEKKTDAYLGFHLSDSLIDHLVNSTLRTGLQANAGRCDLALSADVPAPDAALVETVNARGGQVLTLDDQAGWGDVTQQFRRLSLPRSMTRMAQQVTAP